ncbi:tRNA uridine-5-carboxymethylaminomethyl(34) synthesis GTPase MnmE [bacterium]|nr:tRNA uridine-5-carboxymethylaminomethyl(34) synthesis GTPase MnmE [bacterium]
MSERDTIAAISTPPGPGGVGMVRITGPDATAVGQKIFTPLGSGPAPNLEPRKAFVGRVHHPGLPDEPIDQAVWLYFKGPRSFTGEDTVEITAHGGPLIMGCILEAATLAGARLAEPGEFTKRAFNNGRIDLSQAEAVASLIFASTDEARRVMQRQVAGAMGREAERLRGSLLEVKVALETAIDFPEDVDDIQPENLVQTVNGVMESVENLLDTAREGIAMNEGLRVVIAGTPNVGKSSLLNALLQEDRAIVHEVAGTTRDFIEGRISVNGIPMIVVDTAGIRGEADSLEGEGIARTRNLMKGADLLLIVMDGSRSMSPDEQQLLQETTRTRRVVAMNKSDLSLHPAFEMPEGVVKISALTGQGIDALKGAIHDTYTGGGQAITEMDGVVTSLRQAEALKKVRDGCGRVMEGLRESREPELLAVDLEEALLGVGELTGEVTVDEVLEEIFSRFCIGK